MKKYIIKNCPAMEAYCACGKYYDWDKQISTHCKDITDCLIKRIVNECRNELEKRGAYSVSIHYDFARKILKFVEIEECENE